MLNQITRTLAALISPIASQKKTGQTDSSSADRDAMGQAYENLHQNPEEKNKDQPDGSKSGTPEAASVSAEKPTAQVIAFPGKTPEEILEARKKEIGVSQTWMGLVTELEEQKSAHAEQTGKTSGPSPYEKSSTGASKAARAKKGIILDKKAA